MLEELIEWAEDNVDNIAPQSYCSLLKVIEQEQRKMKHIDLSSIEVEETTPSFKGIMEGGE